MKDLFFDLIKGLLMGICFVVICLILASINSSVYSKTVHPHDESVLTDCKFSNGVHSAPSGFFVRNISMRSHVMAELERDTFMCAGIRLSLSVNPFQPRHHYLTVIGKAPLNSNGAHSHA